MGGLTVGKWIIVDDTEHFIAKCSECGEIVDSRRLHYKPDDFLFCPKCKTKMENTEGLTMDIKTRIDGLTEQEAKAALLWTLNGLSCRLVCDECPSQSICPDNEPLWKGDVCLCLLLDSALKMTRETQR